ncbi:MAG: M4 family metallopeptidase [Ferruginibacter sp.]
MKRIINHAVVLIAFCLLKPVILSAQKNSFVRKPDNKIINEASANGWVRFQAGIKYTEKTIFTDAKTVFGLSDRYQMKLTKTNTDVQGYAHYKFRQTYDGIEIAGAEYIIHTKNGVLNSGNGSILTPQNIVSGRTINEAAALKKIISRLKPTALYWNNEKEKKIKTRNAAATYYPAATLVYLPSKDFQLMILCYNFFIATAEYGKSGYYYVNTQNGNIEKFSTTEYNCDFGSVVTAYYGAKAIYTNDVAVFGHSYDLQDDCQGSVFGVYNPVSVIYNTADNDWNKSDALRSAATCLYSIKTTYTWFKNVFNRNGHGNDDEDLDILNGVDFGGTTGGRNAAYFYDPTPLSVDDIKVGYGRTSALNDDYNALDILAHEFTHGITKYEADLAYESESGALNESFSDIFGEWVEYKEFGTNNWLMGWDLMNGGNHDPLRDYITPNRLSDPDRYSGKFWKTTNGCSPGETNDQCGVHTNSNVQNRMFYLLCAGGTGRTNDSTSNAGFSTLYNPYDWSITGIGIDKAITIAYKVLCDYLTSTSDYKDARNAWVYAAVNLYGECSFEAIQTGKAWDAVGLRAPAPSTSTTNICGLWGGVPTSFTNPGIQNISSNCFFVVGGTGNQVSVKAGTSIHIYPGFKAESGSKFRAYIDGDCRFAIY